MGTMAEARRVWAKPGLYCRPRGLRWVVCWRDRPIRRGDTGERCVGGGATEQEAIDDCIARRARERSAALPIEVWCAQMLARASQLHDAALHLEGAAGRRAAVELKGLAGAVRAAAQAGVLDRLVFVTADVVVGVLDRWALDIEQVTGRWL